MIRVIVDRLEGPFAVVELPDGSMQNIPTAILPQGVKEGDVVDILINHQATKDRAQEIQRLQKELWEEE